MSDQYELAELRASVGRRIGSGIVNPFRYRGQGKSGMVDLRNVLALECRYVNSANQSINNTTTTALALDTMVFDNANFRITGDANTIITFRTAGKYAVWAGAVWAVPTNATYVEIFIGINGTSTNIGESAVYIPASTTRNTALNVFGVWNAKIGDTAQINVFQESGGALNVVGNGTGSPLLGAFLIGR